MPLPQELKIFTKYLSPNRDGTQIFVRLNSDLEAGILARWQGIENTHPGLIATDNRIGLLVRELFRELQKANSLLVMEVCWMLLCSKQPKIYNIKELVFFGKVN